MKFSARILSLALALALALSCACPALALESQEERIVSGYCFCIWYAINKALKYMNKTPFGCIAFIIH